MSRNKVLIAASDGIASVGWMKKRITSTILDKELEIHYLKSNLYLKKAIKELDLPASEITQNRSFSRNEVRQLLSEFNHLLLFWDGTTLNQLLLQARLLKTPTKVFAFEVTKVVNRDKNDDFDIYIGRGSIWGNPFVVGDREGQFTRDEAIEKYRSHFNENILTDEGKKRGLLGLRGIRIACHCKPLACHGDVIAEYLNSLDPDEE